MILSASDVASAARWSSIWEFSEYASEGLVLLGCAGEYIAEYTKWRTGNARHSLGRRSLMILILGLGTGLFSLIKTNALAGLIIASLGEQVEHAGAKAERVASSLDAALLKANLALSTSSDAVSNSTKAQKSATDALGTARSARQEVSLARKEASDAGILSSRVAAEQADRRLSPGQRSRIRDAMRRFPPHQWQAVTFSGDGEAVGLASDIQDALAGAGWPAPVRFIDQSTPFRGIVVEFGIGAAPITQLAAKTLADSLKAESLAEIRGPIQSAMPDQFQVGNGFTQIAPGVTGSVRIGGIPIIPPGVKANPSIPITIQIGRKP